MTTTRTHWNQAAILIVAAMLFAPFTRAASDTTPPLITVSTSLTSLWPPNGKMIPVQVSGNISDNQSGIDAANATFSVYDQDGTVQPHGSVVLAPDGSFSFTVLLEASRKWTDFRGRHYSITVRAPDNAGNPGFGSAVVVVPYDQAPLPVITSITICTPAGSGPAAATQQNCPTGAVDTLQPVYGPDGTPVNGSLRVGATADEHSSVFPPYGLGLNQDYLFFVATDENHHPGIGMAVLSGGLGPDPVSGTWTFKYPTADATGFTDGAYGLYGGAFGQVFGPPNPGSTCLVPGNQTFDLTYAAGGSVVRDPTAAPGSLLMVYEGTNECIGYKGAPDEMVGGGYISLSIATSLDYGKTWPTYRGFNDLPGVNQTQSPNAPMGAFGADVCMGNNCSPTTTTPLPPGYGRYPVVTPPTSLNDLMLAGNKLGGIYGEQEISGFVDDLSWNFPPFLYANSGGMRVARAALNRGTGPLTFWKWDGMAFKGNGLSGPEMSFLPLGPFQNCEAPFQNQFGSSISYVEETRQYLLTFVCVSAGDPQPEPGEVTGSSKGAAWFFSTSYDLSDPMQWTTPQKIQGSWQQFVPNDICDDVFNGWYPTFMSLGKDPARLTSTGYVFSLNGCQTGPKNQNQSGTPPPTPSTPKREYSSRAFTMTVGLSN